MNLSPTCVTNENIHGYTNCLNAETSHFISSGGNNLNKLNVFPYMNRIFLSMGVQYVTHAGLYGDCMKGKSISVYMSDIVEGMASAGLVVDVSRVSCIFTSGRF